MNLVDQMILLDKIHRISTVMTDTFAPSVQRVIFDSNPESFRDWHGSCCNAMALLGAHHLRSQIPELTWISCEAVFFRKDRNIAFNHAYIIGITPTRELPFVFADLSHRKENRNFVLTQESPDRAHPVRGWKVLPGSWAKHPNGLINAVEFMTGKRGLEFYDLVIEQMRKPIDETWFEALRGKDEIDE